jgi:hypothetical protein
MNEDTTKFFACNKAVTLRSDKSWWDGYNILWGHKNTEKCEGILVSRNDYDNFLIFANQNDIGYDKTYQMDITRIKNCFGDYWSLSNFAIYDGRYCPAK